MANLQKFPKVSVIIPVFNSEKFLRQCLDSLINQTFLDFEVILVDDGSTDGSIQIIQEYLAKDDRFSLLRQDHKFAGVARNTGMSAAKGEYFLFLDSDDFFDKNLLAESYEKAKAYDLDICVFSAYRFDSQTTQLTKMTWVCNPKYYPEGVFSKENNLNYIYAFTTAAPWTKLFRRDFILKNNIHFQEIRSANDVVFVYTAIAEAKRILAFNHPLVFYRVNSGNSLQQTKDKDPLSFYRAVMGLREELINRNLYQQLEKPFLNYALESCIFNLSTLKNEENFKLLYNKLRNEIFHELNFAKHGRSFYNTCGAGRYDIYQKILKLESEDYLKKKSLFDHTGNCKLTSFAHQTQHLNIFLRLFNYYQIYGFKNTIKKIFTKLFNF